MNRKEKKMACITHHFACDCREAMFAAIQRQNERLREENEALYKELERLQNEIERLQQALIKAGEIKHGDGK